MIFTERTITIRNDSSSMNAPVILYRGDKNVEVRFTLVESPYKYSNRDSVNIIESTDASYAQLVIKTPNDRGPIFGDITAVGQSNVTFVIGYDMIDEIEEVGTYDFQIRLFDADQTSMATIPEVVGGFIIKEPIAKEDTNNNITNSAIVGSAVVTNDTSIPTFVGGSYNKTAWHDGDVISRQKLNKIENGMYETYELSKDNSSQIKDKVTKGEGGVITNVMLSQEVKEAMTGGSVAVVGKDTILTENIVDKQITPSKLDRLYAYGVLGKNLFDKNDIKYGYINPTTGEIVDSVNNIYYEMEVDPNEVYAYTGFQLGAYYDKDNKFISGTSNIEGEWTGKKLPTNARYIKVSTGISNISIAQIEIGSVPTEYEEFAVYPAYNKEKIVKFNIINVPADFPTITEANNSIIDSDYYNRYNIILDNGIYIEKDITLKPYVNLIGKDMYKTEIRGELPESATDEQITPCSTINLVYSNNLENLIVTCKNMRYPIHDDGGGTDKVRKVKNCKFIHYGNDEAREYRKQNDLGGTVWESENAYGSGVNSGDYMLFEDCIFIGTVNAWGTHNNVNYEKSVYIKHKNNSFIVNNENANSMGIASMGSGNKDKIVFEGCNANAPIKYFTMGADIESMAIKSEFEITGYGNDIPLINYIDGDSYTSRFTDEIRSLVANEEITIGMCCCYDLDLQHIRKMTPTDDTTLFAGIALETIQQGNIGTIQHKGYVDSKILNISNVAFGDKYGIKTDSYIGLNEANIILVGVGRNQLKFV